MFNSVDVNQTVSNEFLKDLEPKDLKPLKDLETVVSRTSRRKMAIGGIAIGILGIACTFNGSSLYDQLMQYQSNRTITQLSKQVNQLDSPFYLSMNKTPTTNGTIFSTDLTCFSMNVTTPTTSASLSSTDLTCPLMNVTTPTTSATVFSTDLTCPSMDATALTTIATVFSTDLTCPSMDATALTTSATVFSRDLTCPSMDATALTTSATVFSTDLTCPSMDATALTTSATVFSTDLTCPSMDATALTTIATVFSTDLTCPSMDATALTTNETVLSTNLTCPSMDATALTTNETVLSTNLTCPSINETALTTNKTFLSILTNSSINERARTTNETVLSTNLTCPYTATTFNETLLSKKLIEPSIREIASNENVETTQEAFLTRSEFYSQNRKLFEEGLQIHLDSFSKMDHSERQQLIEKFGLQSSLEYYGNDFFYKKLAELDKNVLKLANLIDIKFNTPELKYILLTNDEFNQITIEDLKDISSMQKSIIIEKIKNFKKEPVSEDDVKDVYQISITKFSNLNSKQLNQCIDKIPDNIFSLISNDQLQGLDLQNRSKIQIDHLFSIEPGERISLLSPIQLNSVIHKLSNDHLEYYISNAQYGQLDIPSLSEDKILILLRTNRAYRLSLLLPDQLNSIIDKLDDNDLASHITDDQFKELKKSKLSKNQIQKLLYVNTNRVSLLTPYELNSIVNQLSDTHLRHITDDQFIHLKFADLSDGIIQKLLPNFKPQAKRLSLLAPDELNSIINKLNDNALRYHITDDLFIRLNLADLNADKIRMLLSNNLKRISLLSVEQLSSIFDKLSDIHKNYISKDKLKLIQAAMKI